MDIGHSDATKELGNVYRDLCALGLQSYVAELDAYGYTVVPPELVAPPEFIDRLHAGILEIARERSTPAAAPSAAFDPLAPTTGEGLADFAVKTGQTLFYLLLAGRVFEEALLNPTLLALVTYLLGESCLLNSYTAVLKEPGDIPLTLHCDASHIPSPYPSYAQVCNTTYLLTDYSKDNGAIYFVPGSHRYGRAPIASDATDPAIDAAKVAIEAPRGSLMVWHGNTWHGAFEKTTPGPRVSCVLFFCRPYMRVREAYGDNVPPEIIARNPERFAKLTGQYLSSGWKTDGPDYSKFEYEIRAGRSVFS